MESLGAVFFLVAALVLSIMHKNAGEKRRNLSQNPPAATNAAPVIPQAPTNPIKNITPSVPAKNNATNPSAGNTAKPSSAPKKETGKAPKPPNTLQTKTPPAKTNKPEKNVPPAKSKKAPPAKK